MMKKKIVFVLVLAVAFLAMTSGAEAEPWIAGNVSDAADGTPADGHMVIMYYFGDEANFTDDTIESNLYICYTGAIPNHTWVIEDEVYVKVIDTGDGYIAGPVSVVTTGAGFVVAPNMTLLLPQPPIVSEPQAIPPEIVVNTGVSDLRVKVTKTYYDIDTVTVNLSQIGGAWNHTMNGMVNISDNITIYNCTTNANVVGSFNLTVNATDINGFSNTSVSIPLKVTNATQFNFTLVKKPGSTGKNWISIPIDTTITNASALMEAIGPTCDAVNRWNSTEQKMEGWISFMGGWGTNFDIVPGEGYEISVTANTTFNLTGVVVCIGPINLTKKPGSTGKNWIGLPFNTTMSNASSLMEAIGPTCDAVNRWNSTEQKMEGWISFMGGWGTNFNIVADEGYEVSVTANTTWTPV